MSNPSPPSLPPKKGRERELGDLWWQLIPAGGKVSSFEKFYLIRQLSKKPGPGPVWRKVTLLRTVRGCLPRRCRCCDNKKPAIQPPLPALKSPDPLFDQLKAGKRKSETDIIPQNFEKTPTAEKYLTPSLRHGQQKIVKHFSTSS